MPRGHWSLRASCKMWKAWKQIGQQKKNRQKEALERTSPSFVDLRWPPSTCLSASSYSHCNYTVESYQVQNCAQHQNMWKNSNSASADTKPRQPRLECDSGQTPCPTNFPSHCTAHPCSSASRQSRPGTHRLASSQLLTVNCDKCPQFLSHCSNPEPITR